MSSSKLSLVLAASLVGSFVMAAPLAAQVQVPGYSGYQRIALLGNSDSIISVPFARPAVSMARVQSVSGNMIVAQGSPGWATGGFVYAEGAQPNTYYVLILSGDKEGAAYTITANTSSSLTVDPDGESLSALTAGTRFEIIPAWTLGTLFPAGAGVHASTSETTRATEVLFPNLNATTINPPPGRIFYFQDGQWREVGQGGAVRNDVVILQDSTITVRHNVAAATELFVGGEAIGSKLRMPLGLNASGKRDNYVGLQRPTTVTLANSQLVSSGAFSPSATAGVRTDELLVWDNSVAQKNKAASATYYFWNNAWRKVGAGAASFDTTPVFKPGQGVVIRKNAGSNAPIWTNSPNY